MSAAAKELLGALAMMAVHGTVLAAIALVLTRGRRIPPAWQAAVWLVVIVKFALPWAPALPFSLADVLAILRGGAASGPLPITTSSAAAPVAASLWMGWSLLGALWAAGFAFVLLRANRAERAALAIARRASPAPEGRAILAELDAPRRVQLVVGDAVTGPYVIGVLRPLIVVPPALLEQPTLRAALLHELAHVRRFDALGRLVQLIARATFWWYPVVGLASRRLEAAREAACDARALEVGRIERPAYARLLLEMAQLRSTPSGVALAAPYALDHRISSVLGPPRKSRLGLVHLVALVAWAFVALGGARSAEARGVETCVYNIELAEQLRQAHPEADADNDGVLSHDEACELQAELRKDTSTIDEPTAAFLAEPLCCNCAVNGEGPTAPTSDATCTAE